MFIVVLAMNATVRTVSNNPSSPGQFIDVTAAIAGSSAGDTLYIQGSPTSYGNFTVNKKLVLIGAGYDVVGTDYNQPTTVGTVTYDTVFTDAISGGKIIGLLFTGSLTYTGTARGKIHNYVIERSCFSYYYTSVYVLGNNWTIKNCIIQGTIDIGNFSNCLISNNYLYNCAVYNSNQSSVIIQNNLFVNNTGTNEFSSVTSATLNNNIFYSNPVNGSTSCIFNNNISYNSVSQTIPPAGNSGTGNLTQVNPKFVSATIPIPSVSSIIPYWYNIKQYDWHLQASSPGHNAGLDGTDIGIYGGIYPMLNFTGMSKLPLVQNLILKNPVVQKDGTLNISVKAKKQQ
jgi:hypothetical protein